MVMDCGLWRNLFESFQLIFETPEVGEPESQSKSQSFDHPK
jgi:hypothetical protein